MFTRIVRVTFVYLAFLSIARAQFSDDQVPASPDILVRIISALDASGSPLRSTGDGQSAYYLRSARYVGECAAPFGVVHVVQVAFTRSAQRGAKHPSRGHQFVVFLDRSLRVRTVWRSRASAIFDFRGTALILDGVRILDFSAPPAGDTLIVDGEVQSVPRWK